MNIIFLYLTAFISTQGGTERVAFSVANSKSLNERENCLKE